MEYMQYLVYAKQIVEYILACENETKAKIQAKMKHRTVEDVAVLQTMLGKEVEKKEEENKNIIYHES
jgi:hypothetical protein